MTPNFENRVNISGNAGIGGNDQDAADWGPPALSFYQRLCGLSDGNSAFNRNRTDAFRPRRSIYHGKHNVTVGGDFRKQEYNDFVEQNPRGAFTFTGAATAGRGRRHGKRIRSCGLSDRRARHERHRLSATRTSIFASRCTDAYFTDDWRVLPILTINAGVRWDYSAPMTELFGRLVNLDVASGFTAVAPVLGSDPVGSVTGAHYPVFADPAGREA